ncbi:unnamed protein product [Blepharisma stoltei]|uniref:intramembrane prenyl-peptidase Rce1 n=1 Tax=Blepharisma stoltei TaxID=1481888 RepID=A0AAU9JMK4_9CILI|nr:unnamed protein product [Blepharisma stoltei]
MYLSLSLFQAVLWAIFTPLVFIGCITFFKTSKLSRDDPKEILRRIKIIGVVTVLWPALLYSLFSSEVETAEGPSVWHWIGIGITIKNYAAILSSSAVTLVLFIGPLYQMAFDEAESTTEFDLKALRAYVFAPIYEEVIFRSTLITALIAGGAGFYGAVMLSSLIFGVSHLYHLVEAFECTGRMRQQKVMQAAMQAAYTTVFGFYVGYIFVATGSLYAVILVHAFCNFMGLPDVGFMNEGHYGYAYKRSISAAYIIGIVLFIVLLSLSLNPDLHQSWHYTLINQLSGNEISKLN